MLSVFKNGRLWGIHIDLAEDEDETHIGLFSDPSFLDGQFQAMYRKQELERERKAQLEREQSRVVGAIRKISAKVNWKDNVGLEALTGCWGSIQGSVRKTGRTTNLVKEIIKVISIDAINFKDKYIENPVIVVGVMSHVEIKHIVEILYRMLPDGVSHYNLVSNVFSYNGWTVQFECLGQGYAIEHCIGKNVVALFLHHTVPEYLINETLRNPIAPQNVGQIRKEIDAIQTRVVSRTPHFRYGN